MPIYLITYAKAQHKTHTFVQISNQIPKILNQTVAWLIQIKPNIFQIKFKIALICDDAIKTWIFSITKCKQHI